MPASFTRYLSRNVGTSATAVGSYTVPAVTVVTIAGLIVSNTTGSEVLVDVSIFDGVNDTYIVRNCPVPTGTNIAPVGGDAKTVMITGDSLRVRSNTATSIDAVMSVLVQT